MDYIKDSYKSETEEESCPMKLVQRLISGKWKILILWYLSQKPRRFGELNRLLNGTSRGVLTVQLKQLENDKLVNRKSYDEVPPKVVYSLTEIGESFIKVLDIMGIWGKEYYNRIHSENN